MKINVEKIYICHYKKLVDRKSIMLEQLNRFGMTDHLFVEQFDKDTWNEQEISLEYPKINDPQTKMSLGEKSLALKHAWIIEDMHQKGYCSVLVLEDDAILCDDFPNHFNHYKQQLPENWDIGWVGSCFNLKEPQIVNENVYKTDRGSRCTHAFCLSKSFANNMVKESKNINLPSDCFYNYIVKRFELENYWFQPPLALQSLEFASSLNADPNHKWPMEEMG